MENYWECLETNCVICNRKSFLFKLLNNEELEGIRLKKHTVTFRKGEMIRKQGTAMTHVISINSGMVKVYLEGIGHHNMILRLVKATNFIGGPGLYLDQLHHFSITALTDTVVCFIEITPFKELITNNRFFADEFLKDFSQNILSAYNRLILLTQKQMPGRMADAIIYLMDDIFGSTSFDMPLSRQDMGELSAMSKDSALKTLRQFEMEGVIQIQNHKLEIVDVDQLRYISRKG